MKKEITDSQIIKLVDDWFKSEIQQGRVFTSMPNEYEITIDRDDMIFIHADFDHGTKTSQDFTGLGNKYEWIWKYFSHPTPTEPKLSAEELWGGYKSKLTVPFNSDFEEFRIEVAFKDGVNQFASQSSEGEWVNVKDRLPKFNNKNAEGFLRCMIYDGLMLKEGQYNTRTKHFQTVDFAVVDGVTHWKQLPPPPQNQ